MQCYKNKSSDILEITSIFDEKKISWTMKTMELLQKHKASNTPVFPDTKNQKSSGHMQ